MSVWASRATYAIPKNILSKLGVRLRAQQGEELSDAVTRTKARAEGEVIGMTALAPKRGTNVSYVAAARVAPDSVRENPLMQVDLDNSGFLVHVNAVNPKRASALELFALCSYADHIGLTQRGTFDTFSQLKAAADYAAVCGYGSVSDFIYDTTDWESIIGAVKDDYLENGAYDQYLQCLRLMDLFDYQLLKRM